MRVFYILTTRNVAERLINPFELRCPGRELAGASVNRGDAGPLPSLSTAPEVRGQCSLGVPGAPAAGWGLPSHPALCRVCLRRTKSVRTSAGINKLHTVLTGYLTFQLPPSVNELYCERFQIHHALSRRPAWKPVLHFHLQITSNFLLDSVHNVPVSRPEKISLCTVTTSMSHSSP